MLDTTRWISVPLGCLAALLVTAATSHAALTTGKCLAAKAKAAASFRKCSLDAEAKLLEGKEANLMKCGLALETKRGKLDAKAAKVGVPCRFGDNGDGTVTDYDTGLQWQVPNSLDGVAYLPNPNDVDNRYKWTATGTAAADGDVFSEFLGRLNGSEGNPFGIAPCSSTDGSDLDGGFAGRCDWRLPTVAELRGLVDVDRPACGILFPCLDPVFGLVASDPYVTSTAFAGNSFKVWYVSFKDGSFDGAPKGNSFAAMAVRGGW